MLKNKKFWVVFGVVLGVVLIIGTVLFLVFNKKGTDVNNDNKPGEEINESISEEEEYFASDLPKPEVTTGARGELGIDKNINEKTIDQYLNRDDSVYRDMRMLVDPANYENIGGNRKLDGFIKGFEVIPLPYIIPVNGLPSEVGNTYTGTTLFHIENDTYVPNYEESMSIIEKVFPKNKYIFLMCGGGGYAGMMKNFLVSMGWNKDKIYNVGGFWYYEGENRVDTIEGHGGVIDYNFDKVPYHKIEFDKLTKASTYVVPEYGVEKVEVLTPNVRVGVGMSFQLKAIALPNEAKNKKLKYESIDTSVATVDENGLVRGVKEGYTSIRIVSVDGNKEGYSSILVTKSNQSGKVKLDNLYDDAQYFKNNNPDQLNKEFYDIVDNDNSGKYYVNGVATDEFNKLSKEYDNKIQSSINGRTKIFNRLIDEKKNFVIIIYNKDCGKEGYRIIDNAEKILDDNNIQYFYTNDNVSGLDTSLYDSKFKSENFDYAVVAIIKEGKLYAKLTREFDAIKSDQELKNWLNQYIDVK
ncbi:MAG: Ig-like domain-containing protein [Firmicutes bacterium]|nr:Ig-like domain-containing protein [Bacillota bacterium]